MKKQGLDRSSSLFLGLLLISGLVVFFSWPKGDELFFARLPVLHAGRVKPLDTFAREHLLAFSGKTKFSTSTHTKGKAIDWLAEVLFDPQTAYQRKIFKLPHPEMMDILNLKESKSRLYSFTEISKALDTILPLLNKAQKQEEKEQSLLDKQLLNLYAQAHVYLNLSRSFSMILPLFFTDIAPVEGMIPNKAYTYLEMLKFRQNIKNKIKKIKKESLETLSAKERQWVLLSFRLDQVAEDESNDLFKIIPPQWQDDKKKWHSPWGLIRMGRGTPLSADYLNHWQEMAQNYKTHKKISGESTYRSAMLLSKNFVQAFVLQMEQIFNDMAFFSKSFFCYILAFLLLCTGAFFWKRLLFLGAFFALFLGLLLQMTGLLFRMVIMARPPVATLYESLVFVSFVIVLISLIMEKAHKEGYALFTGSIGGALLTWISFKYKGPESMELLVPVLNTNFWLATHVICITTGYGFAILSSVLAHIYIFLKCLGQKTKTSLTGLYKNINICFFVALFFCLFGTILGGIWADQSWGRFWGWDPKENGALLIVIWLLVLLHGRQSRLFKEQGMALGLILSNITVALSWFGVNLLGVGLHSYGFATGPVYALLAFCGGELMLFLAGLTVLHYKRPSRFAGTLV